MELLNQTEPAEFEPALCCHEPLYSLASMTTSPGPLTTAALADLQVDFARRGHRPSSEMWMAIEAFLTKLEEMANGTAEPSIYVSSLDPGIGKSKGMVAFLKAMLASPDHQDASALVCIGRLDGIQSIVDEAGLPKDSYAGLTADQKINELGCKDPATARIVFTTHAMLERRCSGRPFADVKALHYRGKPRMVRIYDEAILPGKALTVSRDHVMQLVGPMRRRWRALGDALDRLQDRLKAAPDKAQIILPDLATTYGVSLSDAVNAVYADGQKNIVEALWGLFGRIVGVRRDDPTDNGNTLLEYVETLSPDIAPLLVLDASARVRETYRLWSQHRGGLVSLPSAKKDYSPLTVHVWNAGGGKRTFWKNRYDYIHGMIALINSKPDERWLVIHHRDMGSETERCFKREVINPDRVSLLNWGRHDATNEYKDVTNVILAGTLFYSSSQYEALTRLSVGRRVADGHVEAQDIKGVEFGESCHLVLQAICRSKVRQCDGTRCYPVNAYVIASKRSGIPGALPAIFPGCSIAEWDPFGNAKKGKADELKEFVLARFAAGDEYVLFSNAKKHIGVPDAGNFARTRAQIKDDLGEHHGILEWPNRRAIRYIKATEACAKLFGDTD